MGENRYTTIEVKIGNYIRRFEMRENYIGAFVVEDKLFNVIGSKHSLDMLMEREISKYHVIGSIVALGEKLVRYNNNDKHIMITDEKKNITTVFTIENYVVVIITIIDKGQEVFVSSNTNKETIVESYGNVG